MCIGARLAGGLPGYVHVSQMYIGLGSRFRLWPRLVLSRGGANWTKSAGHDQGYIRVQLSLSMVGEGECDQGCRVLGLG